MIIVAVLEMIAAHDFDLLHRLVRLPLQEINLLEELLLMELQLADHLVE